MDIPEKDMIEVRETATVLRMDDLKTETIQLMLEATYKLGVLQGMDKALDSLNK